MVKGNFFLVTNRIQMHLSFWKIFFRNADKMEYFHYYFISLLLRVYFVIIMIQCTM